MTLCPQTLVLLVMFFLQTTGCKSFRQHSEERFIPDVIAEFPSLNKSLGEALLITKLDKSEWKIVYGFADNDNCEKSFTETHEQQLRQSVGEMIALWVAPLKVQHPSLIFLKKDTVAYDYEELADRKKFVFTADDKPDLAIIFYCQDGSSNTELATADPYSFDGYTTLHIYRNLMGNRFLNKLIHILARHGKFKRWMSERKRYEMIVLLHELGHSFGLSDTYLGNTAGEEMLLEGDIYDKSDGGDDETVGRQPQSVMAWTPFVAVDPKTEKIQLGEDDIQGIKWLYRYYVTKDIKETDCFADYYYEEKTKGCAPLYPVIFTVQQGIYVVLKALLRSDENLLNVNEQDMLGNTPLHYAAMREAEHGYSDMCKLLRKRKDIDINIRNKAGQTAKDIAGAESKCFD